MRPFAQRNHDCRCYSATRIASKGIDPLLIFDDAPSQEKWTTAFFESPSRRGTVFFMRSGFLLASFSIVIALVSGCAESGRGSGKCANQSCDMAVVGKLDSGVVDLHVTQDLADPNSGVDFSEPADLRRLFVFGEPCSDQLQCADQICVLAGVSGFCSKQCASKSDCPGGFDCYAVLGGGVDPGLVVNICIPENNLLCTQCADATECSATGNDLCLASITGGKFCARDCTNISCPTNFECQTVSSAGQDWKQCMPKSGSCDCSDDLKDTTVTCDLTTPLGTTCKGTYTCQGTTKGWSTCLPPSMTDTLDDYIDNNCDGVDGLLSDAVFVATTGKNEDLCGLTAAMPCLTISYGQQVALTVNRHNVYVQVGSYGETVKMLGGVNIVGGFGTDWVHKARTVNEVHITGSYYYDSIANRSEYISVFAHEFTTQSTLVDLFVDGPDATSGPAGRSSYAIHLSNGNLKLDKVTVTAGPGATGTSGANGTNAANINVTTAMNGKVGGNAVNLGGCCDDSTRVAGGNGGTNSCDGVDKSGGKGGSGGKTDDGCGCCCFGENATGGDAGANAVSGGFYVSGVAYSYGGSAGSTCGHGWNAYLGYVDNGDGGTGGAKGAVASGYWTAKSGVDGIVGSHGTGGGGGGGGGGCDTDLDDLGAGGGGGGAGGCAAKTSGKQGTGGGGSFGVFAYSTTLDKSTLTLVNCKITRGNGGTGGKGGNGGRGQGGGAGNTGGTNVSGTANVYGGNGNNGGHGGHSGAGGGGAGGASVGVLDFNSNVVGTCTTTGGAKGLGGAGGDTVGIGDNDGNPAGEGGDGSDGASTSVLVCSSTATCG